MQWHKLQSKNFDQYTRVPLYTDEGGIVGSIPHTRVPLYDELIVTDDKGNVFFTLGDYPPNFWRVRARREHGNWPFGPELWWVWQRDLLAARRRR